MITRTTTTTIDIGDLIAAFGVLAEPREKPLWDDACRILGCFFQCAELQALLFNVVVRAGADPGNARVRCEPSNGLISLLNAAQEGNVDLGDVERAFGIEICAVVTAQLRRAAASTVTSGQHLPPAASSLHS